MRAFSNILIAAGCMAALCGACCIDSPGPYSYTAGIACVTGLAIAGAGYLIRVADGRIRDRRKYDFYTYRHREKSDLEYIDI